MGDDDPCNCKSFLFCIFSIRDEFSLPIYININLLIQFHSFLPILNLCLSERKRKKISVGNPLDPAERAKNRAGSSMRRFLSWPVPGKVYFSEGISRVNREVGQPGVCDANEPAKLCSLRPRR